MHFHFQRIHTYINTYTPLGSHTMDMHIIRICRSGGDEVFESVQRRFPAGLGPHQQAHRPGFGCLLSFVLRPAVNTQVGRALSPLPLF